MTDYLDNFIVSNYIKRKIIYAFQTFLLLALIEIFYVACSVQNSLLSLVVLKAAEMEILAQSTESKQP